MGDFGGGYFPQFLTINFFPFGESYSFFCYNPTVNKNEKLQSHKLFLDRDILDKWNNNRYEIYTSPNKAIGVVILGEAHQRQQREQMDFIEAVKPTYLLHESQGVDCLIT